MLIKWPEGLGVERLLVAPRANSPETDSCQGGLREKEALCLVLGDPGQLRMSL